jgi:hypothetical protein
MLSVNALKVCLASFLLRSDCRAALAQTADSRAFGVSYPRTTPLPDGTMPLPLPVMPTPVLQDAKTLSEELNRPIPAPTQFSEPLMKPREWEFSPAIVLPSPNPAPTLSPADTPSQSHQ